MLSFVQHNQQSLPSAQWLHIQKVQNGNKPCKQKFCVESRRVIIILLKVDMHPPYNWSERSLLQTDNSPVFVPHTIVNPRAMMVKYLHTLVALPTVLGSDRTHRLARVTNVVHGIVEVIVVSPGSWVADLNQPHQHTERLNRSTSPQNQEKTQSSLYMYT